MSPIIGAPLLGKTWYGPSNCCSRRSSKIRTTHWDAERSAFSGGCKIGLDESRIEFETAIALAPNYAPAYWMLGTTLVLLGEPEAAIVESEKGLRLNPPGAAVPVAYTIMSQGHLLLGHMDKAVELARKACTGNPRLYFTHMLLAAALGLNDELDEARAALTEALKIRPDLDSLARLRAYMTCGSPRYWALREKTINRGLRRAGMRGG